MFLWLFGQIYFFFLNCTIEGKDPLESFCSFAGCLYNPLEPPSVAEEQEIGFMINTVDDGDWVEESQWPEEE